ncbi:hypothetical protein ACLOJK_037036 [Asimina triloba]
MRSPIGGVEDEMKSCRICEPITDGTHHWLEKMDAGCRFARSATHLAGFRAAAKAIIEIRGAITGADSCLIWVTKKTKRTLLMLAAAMIDDGEDGMEECQTDRGRHAGVVSGRDRTKFIITPAWSFS